MPCQHPRLLRRQDICILRDGGVPSAMIQIDVNSHRFRRGIPPTVQYLPRVSLLLMPGFMAGEQERAEWIRSFLHNLNQDRLECRMARLHLYLLCLRVLDLTAPGDAPPDDEGIISGIIVLNHEHHGIGWSHLWMIFQEEIDRLMLLGYGADDLILRLFGGRLDDMLLDLVGVAVNTRRWGSHDLTVEGIEHGRPQAVYDLLDVFRPHALLFEVKFKLLVLLLPYLVELVWLGLEEGLDVVDDIRFI